MPALAGTGLKGVMLGERRQSQKDKTIRSLGHQNHRDREEIVVPGAACSLGTELWFGMTAFLSSGSTSRDVSLRVVSETLTRATGHTEEWGGEPPAAVFCDGEAAPADHSRHGELSDHIAPKGTDVMGTRDL